MEAKRSLGQNFFINENLGKKIVKIVSKIKADSIVEIGPGTGFFTRKLQSLYPQVICIEKDHELAEKLSLEHPDMVIYNEDFLKFDLSLLSKNTIFFGSLPYNVSKPIIRKVIQSECFNKTSFFIIQKEVADKYIAEAPHNNLLSLTTQISATPKKLFDINRGAFRPKPNVEGALIQFTPNTEYKNIPSSFESFLKKCFRFPRKTLKNNLNAKGSSPLLQKRPAELTLEQYLILFRENLI